MPHRHTLAPFALLISCAACSGGPTQAPLLTCDAAHTQQLAPLPVGGYRFATLPCLTLAANSSTTDSAEYLIVAQSAAGTPGYHSAFQLRSSAAGAATFAQLQPALAGARSSVAAQFDAFLRESGRSVAAPAARAAAMAASVAGAEGVVTAPPVVGDSRTFMVCATVTCSSFATVTAPARIVSGHVAIYVDPAAPPGGVDSAYLDSLGQIFDQRVYAVDTSAFGHESDIDHNQVVAVLMTGVVNAMVKSEECQTAGYVAGFFYPGDIFPGPNPFPHTPGEVMYTLVPDPDGTLSCPHTRARVKELLPPTLLHELEHMISYNQHVIVQASRPEQTWLDEALAKYAEELGGRTFLPDSTPFLSYADGDLYDASVYLEAPGDHYLVTPTDQDLGDVGAGWLFMRYVVDQFGSSIPRALVTGTNATGRDNLTLHTGMSFATLTARWALANWVSDLPAFNAPPDLTYRSWPFRATYASLHAQDTVGRFPLPFPLVPVVTAGSPVSLSGVLRAGSGVYVRCLQPPGGGAVTLAFSAPGPVVLDPLVVPQFAVVRIR